MIGISVVLVALCAGRAYAAVTCSAVTGTRCGATGGAERAVDVAGAVGVGGAAGAGRTVGWVMSSGTSDAKS